MPRPFSWSLQWQILAASLFVLAAGTGLYAWITDNLTISALDGQLNQRLAMTARLFERELPWRRFGIYTPGDQTTQTYRDDRKRAVDFARTCGLGRLSLVASDGRIALDSGPGLPGDFLEKPAGGTKIRETLLHRDPQNRWKKILWFSLGQDVCVRLEAGNEMLGVLGAIRSRLWLALAAGACLAVVLSFLLARWLGQRLTRLSEGFTRLQNGVLSVQIPTAGQDEIAFLSRAFNAMASELEKRQFRERREHERRISELRILAGGVAHEIRNPLGAIAGLGDLLARRKAFQTDDEALELLGRLRGEIDRLDRIVQEVLSYARQPQLQQVTQAAEAVLREAAKTDPQCLLELNPPYPEFQADKAGLQVVLRNLLINAREAAGPRGRVSLGARFRPGRLLIYVADDGPGVTVEAAPNIFQPFFTQKPRGAGLGLAIARNIVEAHGGQLRLAAASRGALFVIYLPIPAKEAAHGTDSHC